MALGSFHWNSINSTIDMTEVVFNGILFTRNTIIIKKKHAKSIQELQK